MAFVYYYVHSGAGRENGGRKQEAYTGHDEPLQLPNLVTALVHKQRENISD